MLVLSKNGEVYQYAKSWNNLMDYVDEETDSDVKWRITEKGKESINAKHVYEIYSIPMDKNIKSTIKLSRKIKCWHCNKNTRPNKNKDKCTICKFAYHKFASREEYLTYIIDSLLVSTNEYKNLQYGITVQAIEAVSVSIRNNPSNYPVTVSLYRFMQSKELV